MFDALKFIADHSGMNLVEALEEAYIFGVNDAEPEPKMGKWIQESESLWEDGRTRWECSACCKHVLIGVYADPQKAGLMFCPSCGAKMG